METESMDLTECTIEGCPHMVSRGAWFRRQDAERRAALRAQGIYPHGKDGACMNCSNAANRAARRANNPPRIGRRRAAVVEDWRWLHEQGELDRDTPLADRIRQAAPRLGYDRPKSLERALQRARRRGELETAA